MGVSGVVLYGFVVSHMLGNLKVYLGPEDINLYGEALRDLGGHLVPRTHLLWAIRIVLAGAFVAHIVTAYQLVLLNEKANIAYRSSRDFVAVNFASRTMRYTGTIILLYVLWHLADITWGVGNGDWERGEVYGNLVTSLERPWNAALYIAANLVLAVHLFHASTSMFQTLGLNSPRLNPVRVIFTVVGVGTALVNVFFPIAILTGIVDV